MNISRSSWHYKIVSEFCHTPSKNLCPYVRQLFAVCTIHIPLLCMVIALFLFIGLSPIFLSIMWSITGTIETTSIITGMTGIMLILTTGLGCIYIGSKINKRIKNSINENKDNSKEPSIVIEYIKAKHKKMCPSINFHN